MNPQKCSLLLSITFFDPLLLHQNNSHVRSAVAEKSEHVCFSIFIFVIVIVNCSPGSGECKRDLYNLLCGVNEKNQCRWQLASLNDDLISERSFVIVRRDDGIFQLRWN